MLDLRSLSTKIWVEMIWKLIVAVIKYKSKFYIHANGRRVTSSHVLRTGCREHVYFGAKNTNGCSVTPVFSSGPRGFWVWGAFPPRGGRRKEDEGGRRKGEGGATKKQNLHTGVRK